MGVWYSSIKDHGSIQSPTSPQVTSVPGQHDAGPRVAECPTPNFFKQNHTTQRCWMVQKKLMMNPKKMSAPMIQHLAVSFECWILKKQQDSRQSTTLLPTGFPWTSYSVAQGGRPRHTVGNLWSTGYVLPICRIWWRYTPKNEHHIGKAPCSIGNISLFMVVVPFSFVSLRRNLHTRKLWWSGRWICDLND